MKVGVTVNAHFPSPIGTKLRKKKQSFLSSLIFVSRENFRKPKLLPE